MTLTVDAEAMSAAIPQVESLITLLNNGASGLDGVTVPAGVPAGVASQVTSTTRSGAQALRAKARDLAGVPGDLAKRVAAAQLAEAPYFNAGGWGLKAIGMFMGSFSIQNLSKSMSYGAAARALFDGLKSGETFPAGKLTTTKLLSTVMREASDTPNVPPFLEKAAGVGGKTVFGAGLLMTAASNFMDPRLSVEQKIGRTGASVATGTGVSVLSGAAAGALFGTEAGPPGMLVGFAAGAAWTVVDGKFGVSKKIGDGAAAAMEFGEDVGGAAVDTVGDGIGKVGDGVDKAKSVASDAVDDVGDAIGSVF
jgi:hypothetical protein